MVVETFHCRLCWVGGGGIPTFGAQFGVCVFRGQYAILARVACPATHHLLCYLPFKVLDLDGIRSIFWIGSQGLRLRITVFLSRLSVTSSLHMTLNISL